MPPPPSKRRAMVAEPISEGGISLEEESGIDVDVSMSEENAAPRVDDGKPPEADEAREQQAPATEVAAGLAPVNADDREMESAARRIRSVQQTVPGLSPLDALDTGWDAVAAQIPAVEDVPMEAERREIGADTDRSPPPARAVDVPTPIVPVDFDGTAGAEMDLKLVSQADGDEQTVVRTDTAAIAASAHHEESGANESDRVLEPVSEADGDEQTVARIEPLTTPVGSDEALTSPVAAPPPPPIASPPPRTAVGARRSVPPPPPSLRSGPARVASLPPPPSFEQHAAVAAPAPKPSRPMPLPPRPSLPPPLARPAAEDGGERASLDAMPAAAPLLAPPSFAALSAPPPPPPPVQAAKKPSVPPPPQVSKRPSVPPPARLPAPAATKLGPTENTPTTIQVSSIGGRATPADFTPTVQVQRAASARPLPPPARVPVFSEVPARAQVGSEPIRPRSSSIAPLVDSIPPPGAHAGTRRYLLALAALTFGVAAIFFGLRMRSGSAIITVAAANGGAVRDVVVKIDDVVRCQSTPCEVKDLEPGAHLVSASAAGLTTGAQRAFSVSPGGRSAEHVSLGTAERARAELSVAGAGEGLRVFVDGRDLGAPPVAIRDIEPDTHVVRVTGPGNLYEPYQETVRLEAGEARSLGPVRLKLLRGKLVLRAGEGSDGAKITVDGRRIARLPVTLELSADQSHEVTAQRNGYADFSEEIVFDNAPSRTLEVSLSPGASSEPPTTSRPSRGSKPVPVARKTAAPAAAAGSMATLDCVSTPSANVVVNGRPMGPSPLRGVKVPAGPQTVVFVHASLGRKIASTTVAPGGHGTVGVKF
jgi:hypothetical protein